MYIGKEFVSSSSYQNLSFGLNFLCLFDDPGKLCHACVAKCRFLKNPSGEETSGRHLHHYISYSSLFSLFIGLSLNLSNGVHFNS